MGTYHEKSPNRENEPLYRSISLSLECCAAYKARVAARLDLCIQFTSPRRAIVQHLHSPGRTVGQPMQPIAHARIK